MIRLLLHPQETDHIHTPDIPRHWSRQLFYENPFKVDLEPTSYPSWNRTHNPTVQNLSKVQLNESLPALKLTIR